MLARNYKSIFTHCKLFKYKYNSCRNIRSSRHVFSRSNKDDDSSKIESPGLLLEKFFDRHEGKDLIFRVDSKFIVTVAKTGLLNNVLIASLCRIMIQIAKKCNYQDKQLYIATLESMLKYLMNSKAFLPEDIKREIVTSFASIDRYCCQSVCRNVDTLRYWTANLSLLQACYGAGDFAGANLILKEMPEVVAHQPLDRLLEHLDATFKTGDILCLSKRNEIIDHILVILETMRVQSVYFTSETSLAKIVDCLSQLGIKCVPTDINSSINKCPNCHRHLPALEHGIVEKLNHACIDMLSLKMKGELLVNTTEQELKNFREFIKKANMRTAIGLVVDGLNISYLDQPGAFLKKKNLISQSKMTETHVITFDPQSLSKQLISALKIGGCLEKFKNILVIGRKHMLSWPNFSSFLKQYNLSFYGLHDRTKDDLFILYAATYNPDTFIVSNDQYRAHFENSSLKKEFELYTLTRQISLAKKSFLSSETFGYKPLPLVDKASRKFHLPLSRPSKPYQHYILLDDIHIPKTLCCSY